MSSYVRKSRLMSSYGCQNWPSRQKAVTLRKKRKTMTDFINLENAYRMWVRETLETTLGNDPDNAGWVSLPVKNLMQITIVELYRYLVRKNWPSAQKTTAEVMEIHRKSVLRAIAKFS